MAARAHQYASLNSPFASASAAWLFMYIATTVSSLMARVRNPRISLAGRKSIVSSLESRLVRESIIRRPIVMFTCPLLKNRLPLRVHVSSR